MMDPSSFLRGQPIDPRASPAAQALLGYKHRLKSLRDMFLYEVDYREITKRNIDKWEKELRDIVGGIKRLRDAPHISILLISCDGVQAMIWKAINNLYIASDILQKKNPTVKDRQTLYQKFRECPEYLSEAIDGYFRI